MFPNEKNTYFTSVFLKSFWYSFVFYMCAAMYKVMTILQKVEMYLFFS